MNKTAVRSKKKGIKGVGQELFKNRLLYTMMSIGIVWILIFSYLPMAGLVVAFKKFSYADGILKSPWAGLDNFKFLFSNKDLFNITFNTVYLNLLFIIFGTITSVFLALLFVEIRNKTFKKTSQSIVIIPYFISWAVVAMFLQGFLGDRGLVNQLLAHFGMENIQFYKNPSSWRVILVLLRIWQGAGFGTIIYIATITGFDTQIYEAAKIDGANRFQLILKLTLPMLKTTIVMLTLMSIGNIFKGDFGMIYALIGDNSLIYSKTDVIDTYVYRALRNNSNLGFSTAVSFYQSMVGFMIVLFSNWLTRRVDPDSALF
ncbi:putative aldouronate transport system permease protein [Lachnotalea glycerini]|uniref:Putative aldouronate transport system permease protein n=1 Tax=Lachnotalea glycerini TaxID=1763509 RepID=A0A255IRP7_9FIRM|nr:ABC transporter permease subunit [Lachnotalea glycerini]PXV87762.1 putative aldouronate transport system permease protein [Lachnotalea glycerini]RDY32072.1 sugar ABC transporter permease [Lachnotalea glycerini]